MSQTDNAPNKPVHLVYLCGAVLLFYLLQWSIDWVWGYIATPPSDFTQSMIAGIIAITVSIALYRNDRVYHLANEVTSELKKVTWPTGKEVRISTLTVIVMAIVSAAILGVFDMTWSKVTGAIYG